MSTTGPGSSHRHKTKSGYWSDQTDVASGSTHSHDVDTSALATQAALDALTARVVALEALVVVPPPVVPPPPVIVPPAATGIYGTGIQADAKNNYQVGWTLNAKLSHRFRATASSAIVSLAINQRTGSGYSGGTGGTIRAALQADVAGLPSGIDLATVTFATPNVAAEERKLPHPTTGWPALVAGTIYHIVFTNVDPSPTTNYVSINETCVLGGYAPVPRQPAMSDDYAVLYRQSGGWTVTPDTAVMDLLYANGAHDGNAYYQITVGIGDTYLGGTKAIRERFTVSGGDRTVSELAVRVKRISGSGPITLSLKQGATVLASSQAPSSGIPISTAPVDLGGGMHYDEASLSGGRWVIVSIPPTVIANGTEYSLVVTTDAATSLMAIPLRRVAMPADGTTWGSRAFLDGIAEQTLDGVNWVPAYEPSPHDWQFYLGWYVPPVATGVYGSGINMDGLGNTQIGGPNGSPTRHASTRFRAKGSSLVSIRQQLPNPQPGYAGGNGGALEFTVRTDVGGFPGATIGGPVTIRPGTTLAGFNILPLVTFPTPVPLTVGTLYHLVVRNTDPSPGTNFTSIDGIVFESFTPPQRQPRWPDSDWAALRSETGASGWVDIYNGHSTSLVQLNYAGGIVDGCGYVYRRNQLSIGTVAEVFIPTADRAIYKASVRMERTSGSGGVTIRLEAGGSVVASGSAVPGIGYAWVTVPLVATLRAGTSYRLSVTADAGSAFKSYSLQKGYQYGYSPATYFAEGSVEGDSGGDLQWYVAG